MSPRNWIVVASFSALISVAFGAFGAHALRARLEPRALEVYQTAVHYQMFHSLALFGVGVLALHAQSSSPLSAVGESNMLGLLNIAAWLFTGGILVFSGSLYALAITDIKILGAVTPIGGLGFLAGWATLAWAAWKG